MHFVHTIEHTVRYFALHVPLELFVFIGSFLEEIISPIPSALIMGTAGSLALFHQEPLWYLFWLAMIGNVGKLIGSWIYYFIGDKLEDILIKRVTRLLGIKHEDIESIGKRFVGHHWKDGGVLFLLRLTPFFPTTIVSLTAGIIKMDLRVFFVASYAGNFLKDLFFLYAGYAGLATLHTLWKDLEPVKLAMNILVTLAIVALLVFLYINRGTGHRFLERFIKACFNFFDKLKE